MSNSTPKGFLSLKWKAVLSVSSVLIFGVGLITCFGKKNLEQTYRNQRDRVFQERYQAVTGALQEMQTQLLHVANHMQGLALQRENGESSLRDTLDNQWDLLNFEWGVDAAALYNTRGEQLSFWGNATIKDFATGQNAFPPLAEGGIPIEWVLAVNQSEVPVTKVWCRVSCWQIVMVPTLFGKRYEGIMLLARSLADVVLQFHNTTAADVGILIPHTPYTTRAMDNISQLEHWQRDVIALTGMPVSYNVLKQLSSISAMADLERERVVHVWNAKHYEISIVPMAYASHASLRLVFLDDVSIGLRRLQVTLSKFILAASVILLLAEAVLLWLLWWPMVNLQAVAQTLPSLVRHSRSGGVIPLNPLGPACFLRDETHDLYGAAMQLSHTLAKLYEAVKARTRGLKKRSRELLAERNFVTTLLNNVHVVILTQDRQGYIRLLNAEGQRLVAFEDSKRQKLRFADCVEPKGRGEVEQGIGKLFRGSIRHFRHECEFMGGKGRRLHMDWYHSPLPDLGANGDLVLSVGLDLTARKNAEENLAWLADHDSLTKLYNRRYFQNEFSRALNQFRRFKQPGAVLFFDLDLFKTVNDTYGHLVGDQLLCTMATKLKAVIRSTDTLARLGGDEFAILLEQTNREGVIALAEKLCEQANAIEVVNGSFVHKVSISMGIVLFPEHGETVEELLANADFAMYRAKTENNAHSNWYLHTANVQQKQELKNRMNWKARIESALENHRLLLFYQPILDIGENRISHYEALIRMRDEQGEILPPAMFIPVAEKTGLINEIDQYVIHLAVENLHTFHALGRDITLSINLSARAIAKSHFIPQIENLVKEYGVDRSRLIFELTETSAVEDIGVATDIIGQCRNLGYRFALDDFGVGFASWFYLRQLPVDYVKIDGSFVRHLASNPDDRLFVKAINSVAKGLGKKTIAEFVEDAPSLALSSEFGVDYAQGYYIGRPQAELLSEDCDFPSIPFAGGWQQPSSLYPSTTPV